MKKILSFCLAISLILSFFSIQVNAISTYEVKVGKTISIYRSSSVSNVYEVVWASDSTAVTIETEAFSYCKVRGNRAENNVLITADIYYYIYSGSYTYATHTQEAFRVNVIATDPTSISMKSSLSLNAGSSYTLSPTLSPSGATSSISWSSSNSSVATVSSGGVVRGVGAGSATITARTANGLSASCYVTVSILPLTLSSVTPASGSNDVSSDSVIKFNYNQSLAKGSNFSAINLRDTTTNQTIAFTPSISSSTLTITPSSLVSGHSYTATVPNGALQSNYGAVASVQSTTFTVNPTELVSITPENGTINVSEKPNIILEFKSAVLKGSKWSSIKFIKTSTSVSVPYSATVSSNKVIITPTSNLNYSNNYSVTIPAGAIASSNGVNGYKEFSVSFTVKPGPLQITKSSPVNLSTDIDVDSQLKVVFNYSLFEDVKFDQIILKNQDERIEVEIEREISGRTLTITPLLPLLYNTNYVLTLPDSALSNGVDSTNPGTRIKFKTVSEENEVIRSPLISENLGVVSITAEKGETIYYTTDGSNPKLSGTKYTGAFTPPLNNTLVRAVAVKNGSTSPERTKTVYNDLAETKKLEYVNDISGIKITTDGYITVGSMYSNEFGTGMWSGVSSKGGCDAIIVKYDFNDNVIWKKQFGGTSNEFFYDVAVVDNGYVAVGYAYENSLGTGDWSNFSNLGNGTYYACVVKFDLNGNVLWKRLFRGSAYDDESDVFYGVEATNDGGFIAVGYSDSSRFANTIGDALIVKYDKDGYWDWRKIIGGNAFEQFNDVTVVDGGYIAVGYAEPKHDLSGDYEFAGLRKGSNDAIAAKFDTNGNILWKSVFGGSGQDQFHAVSATGDGGVVVVGESASNSFENGDWKGVYGNGWSDACIVKYTSNGTIAWKKPFGGNRNDCFYDVLTTDDGIIVSGFSSINSIGTGDLSDFSGDGCNTIIKYDFNGNIVSKQILKSVYAYTIISPTSDGFLITNSSDGLVRISKFKDSSVYNYTDKPGKIAVTGNSSVVKGNEFTASVYFTPTVDTKSVTVKLTYPACISYVDNKTDYSSLHASESVSGNTKTLSIICNLSSSGTLLPANITHTISTLRFRLDSSCTDKQCEIAVNPSSTFFVDNNGYAKSFTQTSNYKFTVQSVRITDMFISGAPSISGPTQYRNLIFPSNADKGNITWSVTDSSVATIDQNGLLTPLKNGEITVKATDSLSGKTASFSVTASEVRTYISSLTSNIGSFERNYNQNELNRVLYVPKGTTSINLTAAFTSGTLTNSSTSFANNTATTVSISSLPQNVMLVKKDSGNIDTTYIITVKEDSRDLRTSNVTTSSGKVTVKTTIAGPAEGILYAALYNKGKLVFIHKQNVSRTQTSATSTLTGSGDTVKIMHFAKNNTLKPLCNATTIPLK